MTKFNVEVNINKNGCKCIVKSGKRGLEPLNIGDNIIFSMNGERIEAEVKKIDIIINSNHVFYIDVVVQMINGGIEHISLDEIIN